MRAHALLLVLAVSVAPARAETPEARDREAARLYHDGETKFRDGEIAAAIEDFDAGYRLAPRPEFLFNLAQCYRALGQRAEAIRYLERFIEAAPAHAYRAQAEKTLEELRQAETQDQRTQRIVTPPLPPPPAPAPQPSHRTSSSHALWWIAGTVVVAGGLTAGAIWFVSDRADDGLGRVALPPR